LRKQDIPLDLGIYFKGIEMSDKELKSEIENLVKTSGYKPSKSMLCSVVRVVSMRHRSIPQKRIFTVAREVL
jgi:hypothetical protein